MLSRARAEDGTLREGERERERERNKAFARKAGVDAARECRSSLESRSRWFQGAGVEEPERQRSSQQKGAAKEGWLK